MLMCDFTTSPSTRISGLVCHSKGSETQLNTHRAVTLTILQATQSYQERREEGQNQRLKLVEQNTPNDALNSFLTI
jgi:hypothetical protein